MENNFNKLNLRDRLRNANYKLKSYVPTKQIRQIGVMAAVMLALPVAVLLAQKTILYKSKASILPATLSFTATSVTLPPQSTVGIVVNTSGASLSFAAIEIRFDPNLVHLSSEVNTTTSLNRVSVTSQTEANNIGKVDVVLGLAPDKIASAPNGNLEIANFNVIPNTQNSNVDAYLNWNLIQIQLVDMAGNVLPINSSPLKLTLNPVAATFSPSPMPLPTSIVITNTTVPTKPKGKPVKNTNR